MGMSYVDISLIFLTLNWFLPDMADISRIRIVFPVFNYIHQQWSRVDLQTQTFFWCKLHVNHKELMRLYVEGK
jgi:hypothetical protein